MLCQRLVFFSVGSQVPEYHFRLPVFGVQCSGYEQRRPIASLATSSYVIPFVLYTHCVLRVVFQGSVLRMFSSVCVVCSWLLCADRLPVAGVSCMGPSVRFLLLLLAIDNRNWQGLKTVSYLKICCSTTHLGLWDEPQIGSASMHSIHVCFQIS